MTTPPNAPLTPEELARVYPPNACKLFYDDPSPGRAVQLAIADAKSLGDGTLEFFNQLSIAVDRLNEHETILGENSSLRAANEELRETLAQCADYLAALAAMQSFCGHGTISAKVRFTLSRTEKVVIGRGLEA